MGANYSFYVKTIETYARAFLTLNILAIGSVNRLKLYKPHPNIHNYHFLLNCCWHNIVWTLSLRSSRPKDSKMSWKQVMVGIWLGIGVTVASESRSHLDSNSVSGKSRPIGFLLTFKLSWLRTHNLSAWEPRNPTKCRLYVALYPHHWWSARTHAKWTNISALEITKTTFWA